MNPYRSTIQEPEHEDTTMGPGERLALIVLFGLNVGTIVGLLYMLAFHFNMLVFRFWNA